jgi:hypothetical protein
MATYSLAILAAAMVGIVIWGRIDAHRHHRERRDDKHEP